MVQPPCLATAKHAGESLKEELGKARVVRASKYFREQLAAPGPSSLEITGGEAREAHLEAPV